MKRTIALGLLLALPLLAQAAGPRTLSADIPAAGVNRLVLNLGVGRAVISASPDDQVHVRVTLRQKQQHFLWFFHWMSSGSAREIAAANLSRQRSGDSLSLGIEYAGRPDNGDLKQDWTVELPARLAVDAIMKVGQLTIGGVTGGINARLSVGQLDIDAPRGPVTGAVDVGEIRVHSASPQPGNLSLSSNIGEVALYVNGKYARHAGEHNGLGHRIRLPGSGPDNMKLSVNVGEVNLRIAASVTAPTKP